MDGGKFCVFDRSVLVSNGVLHAKVRLHLFSVKKSNTFLFFFCFPHSLIADIRQLA